MQLGIAGFIFNVLSYDANLMVMVIIICEVLTVKVWNYRIRDLTGSNYVLHFEKVEALSS